MPVRGIDATYYTTKDLERSTAFYKQLLGLEPTFTTPGRISEWTFADDTSFGLYQIAEYTGSRNGSVMFAVSDVAAAVAEAKARDVKFDDHDITETPGCRMAFGRDPDDNQFILHQRKE